MHPPRAQTTSRGSSSAAIEGEERDYSEEEGGSESDDEDDGGSSTISCSDSSSTDSSYASTLGRRQSEGEPARWNILMARCHHYWCCVHDIIDTERQDETKVQVWHVFFYCTRLKLSCGLLFQQTQMQ